MNARAASVAAQSQCEATLQSSTSLCFCTFKFQLLISVSACSQRPSNQFSFRLATSNHKLPIREEICGRLRLGKVKKITYRYFSAPVLLLFMSHSLCPNLLYLHFVSALISLCICSRMRFYYLLLFLVAPAALHPSILTPIFCFLLSHPPTLLPSSLLTLQPPHFSCPVLFDLSSKKLH